MEIQAECYGKKHFFDFLANVPVLTDMQYEMTVIRQQQGALAGRVKVIAKQGYPCPGNVGASAVTEWSIFSSSFFATDKNEVIQRAAEIVSLLPDWYEEYVEVSKNKKSASKDKKYQAALKKARAQVQSILGSSKPGEGHPDPDNSLFLGIWIGVNAEYESVDSYHYIVKLACRTDEEYYVAAPYTESAAGRVVSAEPGGYIRFHPDEYYPINRDASYSN